MLPAPGRFHLPNNNWMKCRSDPENEWLRPAAGLVLRLRGAVRNYARLTCSACRPFGPRFTTNETLAPSSSDLYPLASIAEKWTKTSSPFSRWINANPLAALNHFTVPVSFMFLSSFCLCDQTPHGSKRGRYCGGVGQTSRYLQADSTTCKILESFKR